MRHFGIDILASYAFSSMYVSPLEDFGTMDAWGRYSTMMFLAWGYFGTMNTLKQRSYCTGTFRRHECVSLVKDWVTSLFQQTNKCFSHFSWFFNIVYDHPRIWIDSPSLVLLQCILSIFPASVHQFYANILVYTNDQFALVNAVTFPFLVVRLFTWLEA